MLLPNSVHQFPRPFWVLSNIDAEMDTDHLIDLLHRYDMELQAAAIAQGNNPPPQILPMINIIAIIPANLLPWPHQATRNPAVCYLGPTLTSYSHVQVLSCSIQCPPPPALSKLDHGARLPPSKSGMTDT